MYLRGVVVEALFCEAGRKVKLNNGTVEKWVILFVFFSSYLYNPHFEEIIISKNVLYSLHKYLFVR